MTWSWVVRGHNLPMTATRAVADHKLEYDLWAITHCDHPKCKNEHFFWWSQSQSLLFLVLHVMQRFTWNYLPKFKPTKSSKLDFLLGQVLALTWHQVIIGHYYLLRHGCGAVRPKMMSPFSRELRNLEGSFGNCPIEAYFLVYTLISPYKISPLNISMSNLGPKRNN